MLTYESLIEQAKLRDMPATKVRGILREYLQILVMKQLCRTKSGKKLYFTGGTYLRLVHSIKRFSEDLDFNTKALKVNEFKELIESIKNELSRFGLYCSIRFEHWQNMLVSKMTFPDIERIYNVTSKYSKKQGITIKIETNIPKWKIKTETHVISGFGEVFPCVCTCCGALFADKIEALVKKSRGRHLYDIIYMLSNKFPIELNIFKSFNFKKGPLDLMIERIETLTKAELKGQAETLRPFLFDESEAELLINAHNIVPALVRKYREKSR